MEECASDLAGLVLVMRTLIALAAFSGSVAATAVAAQEFGDVQRGRQLAREVCASCHAVGAGETRSPVAGAPSFEAVANTPGMTAAALAVWLTAHAHPTMPMIVLTREDVRNVSAYILNLRD